MNINLYSIFFFLGLLNLPNTVGIPLLNFVFAFLFLLLFIIGAASGNFRLFQGNTRKRVIFVLLYMFLIFMSLLRAYEFSWIRLLNFSCFSLFLLVYISEILNHCIDNRLKFIDGFRNYIINPFVFYIGINYLFWLLGITSQARSEGEIFIGNAVILQALGYSVERVNFLFSIGINGYAVILGAVLSFVLIDNVFQKKWTGFNIVLFLVIIISILLTDSRSAVLYPILILSACVGTRMLNFRWVLTISPILFVVIPLFTAFVLPLLAEVEFFAQFSRNSTDLFTLNGRVFIWIFAFQEFMNFKLFHLIGHGFEGHVSSGASLKWAFLFISYNVSDNVHPHNSILSMIFDIGYLGLSVILIIFGQIAGKLRKIWNLNKRHALTFYALFLYIILISITESFISFYYLNAMPLMLSLFLFVLALDETDEELIKTN
ncbi:MAG: O-antigen ligase family protein [Bacteroidetes bacterium]|nr:MAG: O-antigen ligase family protein [Bacteroidota bacterium]